MHSGRVHYRCVNEEFKQSINCCSECWCSLYLFVSFATYDTYIVSGECGINLSMATPLPISGKLEIEYIV